jgi:hypothetical protein
LKWEGAKLAPSFLARILADGLLKSVVRFGVRVIQAQNGQVYRKQQGEMKCLNAHNRCHRTPLSLHPFSGVWLGRNLGLNDSRLCGQPVMGAISIVHRFFALVMVISAGVIIRNLHRGSQFRSIELTAVIAAGLSFLLMFVSGSLLSHALGRTEEILALHRVGFLLTWGR